MVQYNGDLDGETASAVEDKRERMDLSKRQATRRALRQWAGVSWRGIAYGTITNLALTAIFIYLVARGTTLLSADIGKGLALFLFAVAGLGIVALSRSNLATGAR